MVRQLRRYQTNDEAINNTLDAIHALTVHDQDAWRVDGASFGDWLGGIIIQLERLPAGHPVLKAVVIPYTGSSHVTWTKEQCAQFYGDFVSKLWPALDAISDAPHGTATTADPALERCRSRLSSAKGNPIRILRLCEDIMKLGREAPHSLKRSARDTANVVRPYTKRKVLKHHEIEQISRAYYMLEMDLRARS